MKSVLVAAATLFIASSVFAEDRPAQEFTDPMALLQAVARNYANAVDTFHLESITDRVSSSELEHQWTRTYHTAIKGPGNLYRIESRTGFFGSYIQISDGVNEWLYQVESNTYVKRPVPEDWPKFPTVMDGGLHELKQAWDERTWLEDDALGYKRAVLLPQETILVEGRRYPCYVVRVSSDDSVSRRQKNEYHEEVTFWIDKQALVFRRTRRITDSVILSSRNLHLPLHSETTELFPVADFDPKMAPETFRFTPPADAKEVASLDPDFGGPPHAIHPKAQMVGQMAPEVSFAGPDGKKIELSSYRGKPLLVDLWATWCGPCLLSMPAVNRIYTETKNKGLVVFGFDQNDFAEDAEAYLGNHHYEWTNFHDEGQAVKKALKADGIPLVVLIDAQGKIVYYDFGGNEAELRKAIAGLGPEFASMGPGGAASSAPAATKNKGAN